MAAIRILLLESEPERGLFLRESLEREGYEVQHARDGAEALGTPGCDLAVVSVIAPVMTGLEYLAMRGPSWVPVVALGASPSLLKQALDFGASAILRRSPVTGLPSETALLGCIAESLGPGRRTARMPTALPIDALDAPRPSQTASAVNPEALERLVHELRADAVRVRGHESLASGRPGLTTIAAAGPDCVRHSVSRAPAERSLAALAIREHEALYFYDLRKLPFTASSDEARVEGIRGFAALPFAGGVLELLWQKPRAVTHSEAGWIRRLAVPDQYSPLSSPLRQQL
jgi:CheY-like chemotaxis protein